MTEKAQTSCALMFVSVLGSETVRPTRIYCVWKMQWCLYYLSCLTQKSSFSFQGVWALNAAIRHATKPAADQRTSHILSPRTGSSTVSGHSQRPPCALRAKVCWEDSSWHGSWWINKTPEGTGIIRWLQWYRGNSNWCRWGYSKF